MISRRPFTRWLSRFFSLSIWLTVVHHGQLINFPRRGVTHYSWFSNDYEHMACVTLSTCEKLVFSIKRKRLIGSSATLWGSAAKHGWGWHGLLLRDIIHFSPFPHPWPSLSFFESILSRLTKMGLKSLPTFLSFFLSIIKLGGSIEFFISQIGDLCSRGSHQIGCYKNSESGGLCAFAPAEDKLWCCPASFQYVNAFELFWMHQCFELQRKTDYSFPYSSCRSQNVACTGNSFYTPGPGQILCYSEGTSMCGEGFSKKYSSIQERDLAI